MSRIKQAPSSMQVIRAIAQREITLGSKRKLVRLLFLASVLPPIILTIVILVRIAVESQLGSDLGWDPLMNFLKFQSVPVALLALGLGAPGIARDRAEDVMFLYATRPLLPWHYALGKILAVAVPSTALMLFPGVLITFLRMAVTAQISAGEACIMTMKLLVISVCGGLAYAGVAVGASAAVKRARWALLIALIFFVVPDAILNMIWYWTDIGAGPKSAIDVFLESVFPSIDPFLASISMLILLVYGGLGMLVITQRVKREMIP